jgi:hypothetical protein
MALMTASSNTMVRRSGTGMGGPWFSGGGEGLRFALGTPTNGKEMAGRHF